jgi:adenosine 3'-phospho 5'-phosphosulfate transporter B3
MRVPVKPKPTPSAVFAVPKPAPSAVLRQAAPPLRSLNSSGNGIGSSETETDDATVIPMEDSGGIDPQPPQPSVVQPSSTLTEKPLTILCLDISRWTPGLQLFSLSMGIFFFFLINGYVEEYLFKMFPSFHFGWYLTTWELMLFALFALIERMMRGERLFGHKVPMRDHMIVAFSVTMARGLTNVSMQLLPYPTLVIFKSLKLLTVMIGSLCIVGRRFEFREYVSAFLLVASATLFSLGDKEVSSEFSWIGITVVLLSLFFDSVQANVQDRILTRQKCELTEAILFSNFFSGVMSLLWTAASGELTVAFEYCSDNPLTMQLFVLRAFVLYHGVVMLLAQIKLFGAVLANVVTTVRKILTVILSFIAFAHPVTQRHAIGLVVFAIALALNDLAKFVNCSFLCAPKKPAPAEVSVESRPLLDNNAAADGNQQSKQDV